MGSTDPFGKKKDLCYFLRKHYWEHYISVFSGCTFRAMIYLSDSAILQGKKQAVKILQRSHGLAQDGIFGPNSKKACGAEDFMPLSYQQERKRVLKTYKQYPRYGKGWLKRLATLDKLYGWNK